MVFATEAEEDPREHLGRDAMVSEKNDLIINNKNDLAVINFSENLKQAIFNRLRTYLAEIQEHIPYGSRLQEVIGTQSKDEALSLVRMHVREALLQEPRIEEIVYIRPYWADIQKRIVAVELEVIAIKTLEKLNMVYSMFV